MASNFPKDMTPEEWATLMQGVKAGLIDQDAYLTALKKLTMAGAVSAEAVEAASPDGVPPFVKSVNIAGSGNAALDGTYLEAKSVAAWMELKHNILKAKLAESTAMVGKLTMALNDATEKVKQMTHGHVPHTIVTDLGNVFAKGGADTFKVPPIVYVSASPGGTCFEAAVTIVESMLNTYNNEIDIALHLKATKSLGGWNAPFNNPVKYEWAGGSEGLFPPLKKAGLPSPPFSGFSPAELSLGAHEPKKPKVTLQPNKWLPPTVKGKGGGPQLSPAAQAKNELAAKKKDQDAKLFSGLGTEEQDKLAAAWDKKQAELLAIHQQTVAKQTASGTLSLGKLDELLKKAFLIDHDEKLVGFKPGDEPPVKEKWIPEGFEAIHMIGEKEPKLVKIKE